METPDFEAQRVAQQSSKSSLFRHCLCCSICLRFANREEEVGAYEMHEIATPPSHANSDTSPPLASKSGRGQAQAEARTRNPSVYSRCDCSGLNDLTGT